MKVYYTYHNLGPIYRDNRFKTKKALDATMKFLRDKAVTQQEKQAYRSKKIEGISYLGLNSLGDLRFACRSEDGKDTYLQSIRFYDLHKRKPRTRDEILRMMRESDVGVYCNDPSFLYWGAAYNATIGKYNIVIETRPPRGMSHNSPKILEMQKKFVLCKHLIAVLRAVPFYWNNMVKDFAEFFKVSDAEMKKVETENPVVENRVPKQEVQTTKQEPKEQTDKTEKNKQTTTTVVEKEDSKDE